MLVYKLAGDDSKGLLHDAEINFSNLRFSIDFVSIFPFVHPLYLSSLPLLLLLPSPRKNGTVFKLTEVLTAHSQLPNTRTRNKHIISPDKKKLCKKRGNIQATSDFSLQQREEKRERKVQFQTSQKKRESFYSFAINHLIKLNNFVIERRKNIETRKSNKKSFNEIAADVTVNYLKQFSKLFFKIIIYK